jgi:hypothetical protein
MASAWTKDEGAYFGVSFVAVLAELFTSASQHCYMSVSYAADFLSFLFLGNPDIVDGNFSNVKP